MMLALLTLKGDPSLHRLGQTLIGALLVGALMAGCAPQGEKVVRVKGRITQAGQPLEVQGRDLGLGSVQVLFYRIGDDGKQDTNGEGGPVDENGYFTVLGRDGRGIPAGKYRIAVRQWDPYPTDKLQGRFDEQNSPIILIDVSKPEG